MASGTLLKDIPGDNRIGPEATPVVRGKTYEITIADAAQKGDTGTVKEHGRVYGALLEVPDLTSVTTFTLNILTPEGAVLGSKTGIADNTTSVPTYVNLAADDIYVGGLIKIEIDAGAAQSGAKKCYVAILTGEA